MHAQFLLCFPLIFFKWKPLAFIKLVTSETFVEYKGSFLYTFDKIIGL